MPKAVFKLLWHFLKCLSGVIKALRNWNLICIHRKINELRLFNAGKMVVTYFPGSALGNSVIQFL